MKTKEKKMHSNPCEFENGILFRGCSCESRNGLQDNCHRSECRGSPECLMDPPTCGPSEFANGKDQTKKYNAFIKIKKDIETQRRLIENEKVNQKVGIDEKEGTFENNLTRDGTQRHG